MTIYKIGNKQVSKEEYDAFIKAHSQPQEEIEKELKISQLKEQLSHYDYIGVKIAMGVATKEQYAKEIAESEKIREQIRELENPKEIDYSKLSHDELVKMLKAM